MFTVEELELLHSLVSRYRDDYNYGMSNDRRDMIIILLDKLLTAWRQMQEATLDENDEATDAD